MTQKEKYALEWNNSAQFFYDHNSYIHLSDQIRKYKTVLEIGCGTGQSTLALLEAGHAVIAVDQNPYCIVKAKQLIEEFGYTITEDITKISPRTVCFIECDVTDMSLSVIFFVPQTYHMFERISSVFSNSYQIVIKAPFGIG